MHSELNTKSMIGLGKRNNLFFKQITGVYQWRIQAVITQAEKH